MPDVRDADVLPGRRALPGVPAARTWLEVLNRVEPADLRGGPDAPRWCSASLEISDSARRTLDPGITWWGWHLPPLFEAGMVLLLGLAMMGVAIWQFSRTE